MSTFVRKFLFLTPLLLDWTNTSPSLPFWVGQWGSPGYSVVASFLNTSLLSLYDTYSQYITVNKEYFDILSLLVRKMSIPFTLSLQFTVWVPVYCLSSVPTVNIGSIKDEILVYRKKKKKETTKRYILLFIQWFVQRGTGHGGTTTLGLGLERRVSHRWNRGVFSKKVDVNVNLWKIFTRKPTVL